YSSLAMALEPALIQACDGDLSGLEWFRSTWQSGGAATARAKFALTDGRVAEVVVKLSVGPAEYRWTTGMEGLDAPEGPHCELGFRCTPRVFAAGLSWAGMTWRGLSSRGCRAIRSRITWIMTRCTNCWRQPWIGTCGPRRCGRSTDRRLLS